MSLAFGRTAVRERRDNDLGAAWSPGVQLKDFRPRGVAADQLDGGLRKAVERGQEFSYSGIGFSIDRRTVHPDVKFSAALFGPLPSGVRVDPHTNSHRRLLRRGALSFLAASAARTATLRPPSQEP